MTNEELRRLCERIADLDKFATKQWKILRAPNGYPPDMMFILDKNGAGNKVASMQGDYNNACLIEEFRSLTPDLASSCLQLLDQCEAMREEIAVSDKLIESRNEVLKALECPTHGQCVPGAIEKIEAMRGVVEAAKSVIYAASIREFESGARLNMAIHNLDNQLAISQLGERT